MRYGKCYSFFLLPLTAALAFSSCKKIDGIDNNKVIRTPYSVILGQVNGEVDKTNDGVTYNRLFTYDGVPARAITISGDNIIFIKTVLRVSTNNGHDWNTVAGSGPGNPIPSIPPTAKWASMILDVPGDRLYAASTKGVGVEVSMNNGLTWGPESRAGIGTSASFTQTSDGAVYGMDAAGTNIYKLPNVNSAWTQVSPATGLPAGNNWYLASPSIATTLIAADYTGANGVYYSGDGGLTWLAYTGLPANQEVLSCAAPLGQVVLAGTDSAGVYRLDPSSGKFSPSNNGLKSFTSVYGIVGKQDIYKNGVIKRYVYIATNNGLYRSEDLGLNWVQMFPYDLRCLY
jgi:hypothetical protein